MKRLSRRPNRFTVPLALSTLAVTLPAAAGVKAQKDPTAFPKTPVKEKVSPESTKQPVLLTASQVDYDQQNAIVTATGNVEISQGDIIVLADSLTYDQNKNLVTARGNVSMLEATGNVYFADELVLKDDMKAGVVSNFKARLSDNSLFVANGAKKIDENHLELFKAAYSPCKCAYDDGSPKTPFWQFKADHILVDQEEQKVRYHDAQFDYFGVPVFYTPYFSHPTPGADNQSGLLIPEFAHTSNLGSIFRIPVYYSIAPDKDLTLTPIYVSQEAPVIAASYRQLFDQGKMEFDGSITQPKNRDSTGDIAAGRQWRGNINGIGSFRLSDNYDWGFDIHRATDTTYLRRYNISNETLLTSRLYTEGFNFIGDYNRTYASAQALAFQGLTAQDDQDRIPYVAPLIDFTWQSHPGLYDSRFTFDANSMLLYREQGDQSRRISATAGWKLPYITDNGQIIEFSTQFRTDLYDVSDVPQPDGSNFSGVTGREVPEASVLWRYPFIRQWENSSLLIEPIAELVARPRGGNPTKIPNEDSLLPEFTDSNLFSTDRFAGLDRIESGPSASYGLRGQMQFYNDKYIDWLFGQQYRVINDPNFPFTNDLTSHFSDYVGRVGINYQPFSITYRFRLNKETLASNRSEVDAGLNLQRVTLSTSYLSLKNDPVLQDKEVIAGGASLIINDNWTWTLNGSNDLLLKETTAINTGLVFKNECVNISSVVGKDYTNLRDVKPSTSFWLRVGLKNLD